MLIWQTEIGIESQRGLSLNEDFVNSLLACLILALIGELGCSCL